MSLAEGGALLDNEGRIRVLSYLGVKSVGLCFFDILAPAISSNKQVKKV
jgi:hypothetical protein